MSTDEREALVAFLHARNEFDYDECQHGTYASSAPHNGEPYAMCERVADALLEAGYRKPKPGPPCRCQTCEPTQESSSPR